MSWQARPISSPARTPPARGARLELRGLTKVYGGTAVVQSMWLQVEGGQFLTLLGPSGSGKTTTLRMVAGFEEPTAGDVVVGGEVLTHRPPHRRNIGMVFQQYALFPHLTVFQNVAYPLEMRRLPRAEIRARVEHALELVRLQGLEDRLPRQLSGGQQQRVALARAIVFEPRVLLMDEPLGALDKRLRELMQVEVRRLQRTLGLTTVSVTHDQVEALVMSDLVAILDRGVLQQVGPPLEIYQRPANQFVAEFIGESNLLAGRVEESAEGSARFTTAKGLIVQVAKVEAGGRTAGYVLVRPEAVRLGPGALQTTNRYEAEVADVLYVGDLIKYQLVVPSGDQLVAKTLASADPGWPVGTRLPVGWNPEDCLIVNP